MTLSTPQKTSSRLKNGSSVMLRLLCTVSSTPTQTHSNPKITTTGLGTCSISTVFSNPRLNVHGVKGLKYPDLSICPDNVGCNNYSTALLIGEKAAMLVAEDLGYSSDALKMEVPV